MSIVNIYSFITATGGKQANFKITAVKGTMFLRYKVPNFIVDNAIKGFKVPKNEVPGYL
jgi:hypothetical protein